MVRDNTVLVVIMADVVIVILRNTSNTTSLLREARITPIYLKEIKFKN